MLQKQFSSASRILPKIHSANFKLVSNNVISNFPKVVNVVVQVDKLSLTSLAGSNIIFIYFQTHMINHINTLLVSVAAIYFIPRCFYYLFHNSSFSLWVLFYREYEFLSPNWKNLHQQKLPSSSLEISYMRGHFCSSHIIANTAISING